MIITTTNLLSVKAYNLYVFILRMLKQLHPLWVAPREKGGSRGHIRTAKERSLTRAYTPHSKRYWTLEYYSMKTLKITEKKEHYYALTAY